MDDIRVITDKLLNYCLTHNWSGHDPYDALNSGIFKHLGVMNSRVPRLALTQLMKNSPIDFRRLLLVPKTQNPKALALFMMALIKLSALGMLKEEERIGELAERLRILRTEDSGHGGWGYSFPWQTRTKIVPRGAPNLICTIFAANALLDAHERHPDPSGLALALDGAEWIINHLYWTHGDSSAGFSYPLPSIREQIHNANFLGAAFLCRIYRLIREKRYLDPALRVARTSASKQNADGSWFYGESPKTHWIDNFHTGYNLAGLRDIQKYAETAEFESHIRKGFAFFKSRFFREDGVVQYYHDRVFPIDIHCIAQSLITLMTFRDLDGDNPRLALRVLRWTIAHMWNERGYFYYQVHQWYMNRISYMRWSQAWMLIALATVLEGMPLEDGMKEGAA